jgi:monoamine oxidase
MENQWNGPIAATIASRSIASWLDEVEATTDVRATANVMRGFFVADPEELSLLVYVEQFAAGLIRRFAPCTGCAVETIV